MSTDPRVEALRKYLAVRFFDYDPETVPLADASDGIEHIDAADRAAGYVRVKIGPPLLERVADALTEYRMMHNDWTEDEAIARAVLDALTHG